MSVEFCIEPDAAGNYASGVYVTEQSVVSRADGWLTAWVGLELVMMSGESGVYISLSETGGRIWELLEDQRTVGSLCETLSAEYEVTPDVVRAEVLAFLEQLDEQEAIHVESPAME
jgi:hypothetical protein